MDSNPQAWTILILSANPKGTNRLRLDEEVREIKEGLRRARMRDRFSIVSAEAVRYRDIHRAILDNDPQIVHFSGHGAGSRGLIFEDETGQEKLIEAKGLALLFKEFSHEIKCVVLNACYSQHQAKAIAKHIDYVVGMSKSIGDRAAIEFAVGFYDALGAGRSIENAHNLGCSLIRIAGISEHLTPKLLGRTQKNTTAVVREEAPTGEQVGQTVTVIDLTEAELQEKLADLSLEAEMLRLENIRREDERAFQLACARAKLQGTLMAFKDWNYHRNPTRGWDVVVREEIKGTVVKDGAVGRPWRWRFGEKCGGLHYTRDEAAADLLLAYREGLLP